MSEANSDLMPDLDVSEIEVQFCRLCDQPGEKMFGIFDDNEDGYQIIRLIKENLPIVIYKSDPLSKNVCDKCVEGLEALAAFKRECRKTQDKYVQELKQNADISDKDVQLYLGCTGNKLGDDTESEDLEEELQDKGTSTEDLTILCRICKQSILDASTVNGEVELSRDLHTIIAESLKKNHVSTGDSDESEKVLRKRKVQPLYNEFDDSSCSDLTGFSKNTEDDNISQFDGNELNSDIDSEDSGAERPQKRRKVENGPIIKKYREAVQPRKVEENGDVHVNGNVEEIEQEHEKEPEPEPNYEEFFQDEPDIIFEPLTLLEIALNAINIQNVPDYEPIHYVEKSAICNCLICGEEFRNVKLLALHERCHIEIELTDRIDNPVLWHKSRPDAGIRNKWLTKFDECFEEEEAEPEPVGEMVDVTAEGEGEGLSLLEVKPENAEAKPDQIILVDMKPIVNGTYLGDYSKEERKSFYQCMRVGGQTKRFCTLCRYVFKDNWAIESHYFSLACHYTCKFCGMRFNKQRHRYEDHVKEHKKKKDSVSQKIYTASKVSNAMPKIIQPERVRKVLPLPDVPREVEDYQLPSSVMLTRKLDDPRSPLEPQSVGNVTVKQEPQEYGSTTNANAKNNQAYFCRKCYKVFFKLEEFNVHNQQCNFYATANRFPTVQPNQQKKAGQSINQNNPAQERPSNGEVSSTGRPLRNCAKDMGPYKDEVYIPHKFLNETLPSSNRDSNSHHAVRPPANQDQDGFICHICGTPFPTVYSRNSHMRIHKGEPGGPAATQVAQMRAQQQNFARLNLQQRQQHIERHLEKQQQRVQQQQQASYARFDEIKIKEEPMDLLEPMVEINEEAESNQSFEAPMEIGGGAVSITPLPKKPKQLDPSIMEMVKNNPNISLQPKPKLQSEKKPSTSPQINPKTPNNVLANYQAQQQYQQRFSNSAAVNYSGNAASFVQASYGNAAGNFGNVPQQFRNSPPGFGSGFLPALLQDDNKSYKCSSCWEAFSNKSHLYFHKKNQCEGSRFPCPFCKKRFGTEAAYSSHIFYSHPE